MATPRLNRWQAGALALAAVALLLVLEVIDEQSVDFLELGLEVVEISLIVAASIATMMLFGRVEDQEKTQQEMSRETHAGETGRSGMALARTGTDARRGQRDRSAIRPLEPHSCGEGRGTPAAEGIQPQRSGGAPRPRRADVRQQALAIYRKSNLSGRASPGCVLPGGSAVTFDGCKLRGPAGPPPSATRSGHSSSGTVNPARSLARLLGGYGLSKHLQRRVQACDFAGCPHGPGHAGASDL